jgi:hypothetical protein
MAADVLTVCKSFFACCAENSHRQGVACRRLRPRTLVGKKVVRQRVLTDAEIQAFWHAAERLGYPYGPMYQLLLLTGTYPLGNPLQFIKSDRALGLSRRVLRAGTLKTKRTPDHVGHDLNVADCLIPLPSVIERTCTLRTRHRCDAVHGVESGCRRGAGRSRVFGGYDQIELAFVLLAASNV